MEKENSIELSGDSIGDGINGYQVKPLYIVRLYNVDLFIMLERGMPLQIIIA
jgi:hypothetical protein